MRAHVLRLVALVLCLSSLSSAAAAQPQKPPATDTSGAVMSFEDYEPRSTLVVPEHPLTRARYPFIDVHNHQDAEEIRPRRSTRWSPPWTGSTWRSW